MKAQRTQYGDISSMTPMDLIALSEDNVLMRFYFRAEIYTHAYNKLLALDRMDEAKRVLCEATAFRFRASNKDKVHRFLPSFDYEDEEHNCIKIPDYNLFTPGMYEYLKERAKATSNSAIRAWYADIIWDSRCGTDGYEYAKMAIEAYCECSKVYLETMEKPENEGLELADAVIRALHIAVMLNDQTIIDGCIANTYNILQALEEMNAYRWMLDILEALVSSEKLTKHSDLNAMQAHADRAIKHYEENEEYSFEIQRHFMDVILQIFKHTKDHDGILATKTRIARSLEDEAIWVSENNSFGYMIGSRLLEKSMLVYQGVGDKEKVKGIVQMINVWHKKGLMNLKVEVLSEDIQVKAVSLWLTPYKGISISDAINLMCHDTDILPSYKEAVDFARWQRQYSPLIYIFKAQQLSDEMSIKFHSTDNELDAYYAAQYFRCGYLFSATVLLVVLFEYFRKRTPDYVDEFVKYIRASSVVEQERMDYIECALMAYKKQDYISCVHILAPQIEGLLRDISRIYGDTTTKYITEGEWEHVLMVPIIESIRNDTKVNGDLLWLIQLFLADKKGDNMRNKICHGYASLNDCSMQSANLMVYIVMMLAAQGDNLVGDQNEA